MKTQVPLYFKNGDVEVKTFNGILHNYIEITKPLIITSCILRKPITNKPIRVELHYQIFKLEVFCFVKNEEKREVQDLYLYREI